MDARPASGRARTLDAMMVDSVGSGFIVVREPFDQRQKVRVLANAHVKKWQSVLVVGTVSASASAAEPCLTNARVYAYVDRRGRVIPIVPKSLDPAMGSWQTIDVTSEEPVAQEPEPQTMTLTAEEGTVLWATLQDHDTYVSLTGKLVVADYDPDSRNEAFFYIQEINPNSNSDLQVPCGIKVLTPSNVSVVPGDVVTVSGTVHASGTTHGGWPDAECYIEAATVSKTGTATVPHACGMPQYRTAGGERGLQSALYRKSADESSVGFGLNPVGSLVKVWGFVTWTEMENDHVVYWLDDTPLENKCRGLERTCIEAWDGPPGGSTRYDRRGIKVIAWWPSCKLESIHGMGDSTDYLSAVGVLGAEFSDDVPARPVPVVRMPYLTKPNIFYVKPPEINGSDSNNGSTWEFAKATVQAGINAASSGDEVWVAEGTYLRGTNPNVALLADGVAVFGGFAGTEYYRVQRELDWGMKKTILDGEDEETIDSVVYAGYGCATTTRIDGFTITGGAGGGIQCISASPVIANNTIEDNVAYGSCNGGVLCFESTSIIWGNNIWDNIVSGNVDGGGIFLFFGDTAPDYPRTIIGKNTIQHNCVDDPPDERYPQYGGGIAFFDAAPIIWRNTISDNVAQCAGGGIYCGSGKADILDNSIMNNGVKYWDGGGISCTSDVSARIDGNWIEGNWATGLGGGVAGAGASPVVNNVFVDNYAVRGGGLATDGEPEVVNNTFVGNVATGNELTGGYGGAVLAYDPAANPLLVNNIFYNNVADSGAGNSVACWNDAEAEILYCAALSTAGISGTHYNGCSPGTGSYNAVVDPVNIFADSLFHLAPAWMSDYSPRDKGYLYDNVPRTDRDALPRPDIQSGLPDIGAYEAQD